MTQPLTRLRRRLTAWYVGTFSLILLVLGVALFVALSAQLSGDLDRQLESAMTAVRRAAEVRQAFGTPPEQALHDAVAEITEADHLLYLFGQNGKPALAPTPIDPHIAAAAVSALNEDSDVRDEFRTASRQRWRLRAEPIVLGDSAAFALVAVADATGFRQQFERLLETFIAAALLALLPVAVGGYHIARLSVARVEYAMQRLRDFTADAAHELRTPVSIIRGHAELAVERPRDAPAYATALQYIATEAERLGRLVDNLLQLARAEAGEQPRRRESVFLDDLADEAVGAAAVLGAPRGVHVALGRFEETTVTGDPDLLRQVLMILLDNAVKFTPSGGSVRVDVFVEAQHPTVAVEDTGLGIAAEHLPHIFERFYRGDRAGDPVRPGAASSTSNASGAGLGLAIAHWVLEQHGAHIDINSALNRGTRIHIRFPPPTAAS